MKKCYESPRVEFVYVDVAEIIAYSPTPPIDEGEYGEGSEAAQYRSSLWN